MGIAQVSFDNAILAYNKAMKCLDVIGDVNRGLDHNFSDIELKRKFDIVLQIVLLRVGISDYDFCRVERQFIQKITSYGDFLDWLNTSFNQNLTWEMLENLPERNIKDFLDVEVISNNGLKIATSMMGYVAIAELFSSMKYSEILIEQMCQILGCFICVDGNSYKWEEQMAVDAIKEYLQEPLDMARKLAKEHFSNFI